MKPFLITAAIVIAIGLLVANYQNLFKSVVPPNPVIVSSKGSNSTNGILEYSYKVRADISNKGGDGNVVFEATVSQGRKSWTKTMSTYLTSYQTKTVELVFDEAKFISTNPEFTVRAYPLGH